MKNGKKSKEIFNDSHIQDLLKDTLKKYSDSQKQIEEAFERYRPQISKITEQANIVADRFKDISERLGRSSVLKEISKLKLDNQAKTLMEQLELPAVLEQHTFHDMAIPSKTLPPIIDRPLTSKAERKTILELKNLSKQMANLEELVKSKFKEKSTTFTEPIIKLPPKTHWKDIKIKFKNKFDVEIYYRNKIIKTYSHEELGFVCDNKKDKNPDKQWEFLRYLSVIYKSKELSQLTIDNLCHNLKILRNTCLKRKSNLSKQLQDIFGIEEDPFLEYDPDKGYQTRFNLEPEALLRSDKDPYLSGGKYIDNLNADDTENDMY